MKAFHYLTPAHAGPVPPHIHQALMVVGHLWWAPPVGTDSSSIPSSSSTSSSDINNTYFGVWLASIHIVIVIFLIAAFVATAICTELDRLHPRRHLSVLSSRHQRHRLRYASRQRHIHQGRLHDRVMNHTRERRGDTIGHDHVRHVLLDLGVDYDVFDETNNWNMLNTLT